MKMASTYFTVWFPPLLAVGDTIEKRERERGGVINSLQAKLNFVSIDRPQARVRLVYSAAC